MVQPFVKNGVKISVAVSCTITVSTFAEKLLFRKAIFRITYFFWRAAFFQKTVPIIAATFSEELTFYNILFQKSCYFTATHLFHSCTPHLFVSNKWTGLSCVAIAQRCIVKKVSWPNKVLWNSYFLTELLFQNLYILKTPAFFKAVIRFRKSFFPENAVFLE